MCVFLWQQDTYHLGCTNGAALTRVLKNDNTKLDFYELLNTQGEATADVGSVSIQ